MRREHVLLHYEDNELVKGSDGVTQYTGGRTISIEINQHMSLDDFISIVCGALKMSQDQVKIEFTIKFDSSSLILLYDDSIRVDLGFPFIGSMLLLLCPCISIYIPHLSQ